MTPHAAKEVVKEKQKQKKRQRQYYNKGTTPLKPLKTGDMVKLRSYKDGLWSQDGTIVQEVAPRYYQVETGSDVMLRRNRCDLRLNRSNGPVRVDLETTADAVGATSEQ